MEAVLKEIIDAIVQGREPLDDTWLTRLIHRHNAGVHDASDHLAKRQLLPYYLKLKRDNAQTWQSWNLDEPTERKLLKLIKMKPRRTASGVATVSVITKPYPCSSDCVYCPSDIRMPKSYLANEPACQRAEQHFFDPYLQVSSRLTVLKAMGHTTDKVELIVLGGTWNDYPESYQVWFVSELFRALNDWGSGEQSDGSYPKLYPDTRQDTQLENDSTGSPWQASSWSSSAQVAEREAFYLSHGQSNEVEQIIRENQSAQQKVNAGLASYNELIQRRNQTPEQLKIAELQQASFQELEQQQNLNRDSACRCVGLSIETRPDLISPENAITMRRLGCTKVQIGIQSLDQHILDLNERKISVSQIEKAFSLLRLFGFKIQVHMMANLLGATTQSDKEIYEMLVSDPRFCPDEVKLYPCALVESSRLRRHYENGSWTPYTTEELIDLLVANVQVTPAYTRISRMIRDISAEDIMAGNKLTNLRQMVDEKRAQLNMSSDEIRGREVATKDTKIEELKLTSLAYPTHVSEERFLQWVTPDNKIAGFLRLSLTHQEALNTLSNQLEQNVTPIQPGEAMIREVHIYGRVAGLGESEEGGAQHAGLGKQLITEACSQAQAAGYHAINVISAVGTQNYYARLGFKEHGLYQQRALDKDGTS